MPKKLDEITTRAFDLYMWCSTLPSAVQIQKIAHVCPEICKAASSLNGNSQAEKLAAFIVAETEKVASQNLQPTPSPETMQQLELFETKLDAICQTLKHMASQRGTNFKKVKSTLLVRKNKELCRFKAEVKDLAHKLTAHTGNFSQPEGISRSDHALEIVSLGAKILGAVTEAPALNLLNPAVGVVKLICEQAKSVRHNQEAAADLARHSSIVMKSIVEYAGHSGAPLVEIHADALKALESALGDIQNHLATLQNPRRRLTSWVMADQEKEKISRLDRALDRALALFTSTNTLKTYIIVQAHDAEIRRRYVRLDMNKKAAERLQITASSCAFFFLEYSWK